MFVCFRIASHLLVLLVCLIHHVQKLLTLLLDVVMLVFVIRHKRYYGIPLLVILLFGTCASVTATNLDNFIVGLMFTPALIYAAIKNEDD